MNSESDADYMRLALDQARLAAQAGEVPVGAIVVQDGRVIGVGHNTPVAQHDPTAHAEIVALRQAAQATGNYRLDGCTLYVTLEPCAMCSGAMLNARLERVVYGAAEPRTGAAGSVVNLFDNPQLNHQTRIAGAVLAKECSTVLQHFFLNRRSAQAHERQAAHPLRDDALRTPDSCFSNLPDYPWAPQYVSDLPALQGLRLHYLDTGPQNADLTYLCLHGNPAWSYLYRKMIPVWEGAGHRVIAPDLIGFGKSDKPKRESAHSFSWHRSVLLQLIERLDLQHVVLVVQDWGGLLGLTLPMEAAQRYTGLLVMNTTLATGDGPLSPGFLTWREMCAKHPDFDIARLMARGNPGLSSAQCAAYTAPFPDRGHRAATRAFPKLVPDHPDAEGAAISRQAREFWRSAWQGTTLMAVGMQDPVLGWESMQNLQKMVRHCPLPLQIPDAGHFVQEQGALIAQAALQTFRAPPGHDVHK